MVFQTGPDIWKAFQPKEEERQAEDAGWAHHGQAWACWEMDGQASCAASAEGSLKKQVIQGVQLCVILNI